MFLLQQGAGGAASRQADVWWCFAFLPLVPLSRWQIEALAEPTEQSVGLRFGSSRGYRFLMRFGRSRELQLAEVSSALS